MSVPGVARATTSTSCTFDSDAATVTATIGSGQSPIYTSDATWVFGSVTVVGIPHIIGCPFRDRISVYQTPAVAGSVHFSGTGGNDVLIGGPRRDRLEGGPGDDRLNGKGGLGSDTLLHCEA